MQITTSRLRIRPFEESDLQDLHAMLGDSETMRHLEPAYSLEKTRAFLGDFCIIQGGALAAVHRETGRVIGYILFKPFGETSTREMGWIIRSDYRRQDYAFEACDALIRHAFTQADVQRLFAETSDTLKSIGLMRKLGMRPEGQQDGLYVYSLNRSDFFAGGNIMNKSSRWIWGTPDAQPDEYWEFLIPFDAAPDQSVRLQVSADSEYALELNGEIASFGQYADYPDYKVFDDIDLTGHIRSGSNELRLQAWYTGVDTQTYIKKPAGVRFALLIDGTPAAVSGTDTFCRPITKYIPHRRELITSQLGLTFACDTTAPEAAFAPAHIARGLPDTLFPRPVKKLTLEARTPSHLVKQGGFRWMSNDSNAQRMQKALFTDRDADGVYAIYDLGSETTGFLTFDITVPRDCNMVIGWGEHLIDGRCRTAVRSFACSYRAKAGRNEYMNPFRRFGCRYLQIFIETPEAQIDYLGIRPTLYPLNVLPWRPDDPLRRRIYETCLRTLQLCMHEHYEDCPWREQALYTLDSRNQMLCGYHAFGETAFPRAGLDLISHGMRPDGLLSLCYPAGLDFPIPAFSLVYFIQMHEYLSHSGDIGFLREKYPFLCILMQRFLSQPREDGLIENFHGEGGYWNFYEWSDGMSGRFNEQQRRIEAPLNAFLSLALQHMASIADALGEDGSRYTEKAKDINRALAQKFYLPEAKLFESYPDSGHFSVLTNSLCLLCGAAEGLDKRTILRVLAANGAADTGITVVPNTLSMNCFRFDALLNENRSAYTPVILREIDDTYAAMLDAGTTTFWETALGAADFDGAGSLCHGWSALPVYYYATLLK